MNKNLKNGLVGRLGRIGGVVCVLVVLSVCEAGTSSRTEAAMGCDGQQAVSMHGEHGRTRLAGILLSKRTRLIINFKATMLA